MSKTGYDQGRRTGVFIDYGLEITQLLYIMTRAMTNKLLSMPFYSNDTYNVPLE